MVDLRCLLVSFCYCIILSCLLQWLNKKEDYDRFCHAEDFDRMQEEGIELSADSRCLAKQVEDWRKLAKLRREHWRRATGMSRSVGLEW